MAGKTIKGTENEGTIWSPRFLTIESIPSFTGMICRICGKPSRNPYYSTRISWDWINVVLVGEPFFWAQPPMGSFDSSILGKVQIFELKWPLWLHLNEYEQHREFHHPQEQVELIYCRWWLYTIIGPNIHNFWDGRTSAQPDGFIYG